MHTLIDMLSYMRPAGSKSDRAFRRRYLLNLPGAWTDNHRNIHVIVGAARTIWSSHTDTVHRTAGQQRVVVERRIVRLPAKSKSHCLGADDTVGVYLMREMILAGRPGHYVFHYGEERGGIGSSALVRTDGAYFQGAYDHVIAFDRQGTRDIVTHQFGRRTCSDRFAWGLSDAINAIDPGLTYEPAHGVYTDSAEYADLISECTNISVGYSGQHTPDEIVDLSHVKRIRDVLLELNTADLIAEREPGSDDRPDVFTGSLYDDDDEDPDDPNELADLDRLWNLPSWRSEYHWGH